MFSLIRSDANDQRNKQSYSASQPTKSSSSTLTKTPYEPSLLLIHSDQEETISLSPFFVQKTIMSLTIMTRSKVYLNDIVKCLGNLTDCSLYVDDFCICYRSKLDHTSSKNPQDSETFRKMS